PFQVQSVKRSMSLAEFLQKYKSIKKESDTKICLVGRVMAIRQTFGKIQDFSGQAQFYLNKTKINSKIFEYFKKYVDIGDIVEIHGTPFKTHVGELTLNVLKIRIVSKSLKPLPEKWHGLQDEELRARQRYVDLIMNNESMKTFVMRSQIIKHIRTYLDGKGFIEVETPILQSKLGGAAARPFTTKHNVLKRDYYLRIATEISLKKLIVGGFEKIFEIGRIFRNEGMDSTHNPEFTSMELYLAYAGMDEIMDVTEKIFHYVSKQLKIPFVEIEGNKIYLNKKFKIINMIDFIKEVVGVDFHKINTLKESLDVAKKHKIHVENHQKAKGHIINLFFEAFCEEKCIQPTFVWGHPVEVSPLSKRNLLMPEYTNRFELFINKKEYANAFAELNDPIDQYMRFEEQIKEKQMGNEEANEMDMEFIDSLEHGLPPTGGLGIGIDRMAMLFSGKSTIRDVLLFPHMKEKD
ncbi:MAG: lysine--tRNA ligase, partial [Malacoplasma sp.]